jgi:PAS domain S-box-containing protein
MRPIETENRPKRQNHNARSSLFNGAREGWFPDDSLPADLLAAESVLTALAGIFYPTEESSRESTVETAEQSVEELDEESARGLLEKAAGQTSRISIDELDRATDKELPGLHDTYRILVEQIPAVVFLAFFDKVISEAYVSPQIEATLGFTQEEWLKDPVRWYRHIHPDDKARWSAEAAQIFLTGEPLRSVYRVLARDGSVVWFHCEVKMVRHLDGRPWFIHGVGFDLTELKQAEEALSRSEEMLRGIFEYAPDTMVVAGREGRIERVNTQVERMFGYRREELLGQQVEMLVPERFRSQHILHRADYIADPHLRPMGAGLTLYGRRKDGGEFPVEIMLSPVEGGANGLVIAVIRDITRRQRDEAALRDQAERMKVLSRRLLAVQEAERRRIALELHDEIGQILTGLKLKLEMSARQSEGTALESLTEAQTVVNELMARTRQLSLDLRPATLDHLGLLPTLLRHIRQYTAQTQVRVDLRHGGLEGRRFAPELETAVFRLVQEGLTNVARHAQAVDARVFIWADQQSLKVQIEDDGHGFDAETAMAAGQSNGLTGMRERVVLLGGRFTVESLKGHGTNLMAEWNLTDNPDLEQRRAD